MVHATHCRNGVLRPRSLLRAITLAIPHRTLTAYSQWRAILLAASLHNYYFLPRRIWRRGHAFVRKSPMRKPNFAAIFANPISNLLSRMLLWLKQVFCSYFPQHSTPG